MLPQHHTIEAAHIPCEQRAHEMATHRQHPVCRPFIFLWAFLWHVVSDGAFPCANRHDATINLPQVPTKRRFSDEHFIDYATITPPVRQLVVTSVHEDLGCKELRAATHRVTEGRNFDAPLSNIEGTRQRFSQAKVAQLQVAVRVDKTVLGFDITVNNVALVHVHESLGETCGVEAHSIQGQQFAVVFAVQNGLH